MTPVLIREMEIYADFLSHVDHHVGRLLDALKDLEILDDTLVYLIIGDNGASAEGSLQGTFNEMVTITGFGQLETPKFMNDHLDKFGGPEAYNQYAVGWAHAMDTPFHVDQAGLPLTSGGQSQRDDCALAQGNPSQRRDPQPVPPRHRCRANYSGSGGSAGARFRGWSPAAPIEGVSMLYSFNDSKAAGRHETQYFEMVGNRGIYHNGWTAVTKHRTPWETGATKLPAFDDDVWELYDTNTDWSQSKDLAKANPAKLHELQRLWLIEAVKYNVLPLDDRFAERANPRSRWPASVDQGDTSVAVRPPPRRLTREFNHQLQK